MNWTFSQVWQEGISMSLSASAPKTSCPPAIADLLTDCGIDPSLVGDDWLDVLYMVAYIVDLESGVGAWQ